MVFTERNFVGNFHTVSVSVIPMDQPTLHRPRDSSRLPRMELALVRTLTWSTWERLRQQSIELCASCKQTIRRTQELRARHRLVPQEQRSATLGWNIRRKLRSGRLPHVWLLILSADPGAGGMCDACDNPLLSTQMVMTLRGRDPFVRLQYGLLPAVGRHPERDRRADELVAGHCPSRV